ncbi:dipeptidase 1-like [Octopus bimaculoides]|uniref:dipeptidase 1-like n=1 Tax=Octopus bimaculoides TaxID=37653 RepID=UPI0022E77B53|nr:dipeptidase 1-like [Octopus bimaculoides]
MHHVSSVKTAGYELRAIWLPFLKVIVEMNRLGMLVDLSHVAVRTMEVALEVSKAPVIFSHTSAFAVCNHYRNAPDAILKKTKGDEFILLTSKTKCIPVRISAIWILNVQASVENLSISNLEKKNLKENTTGNDHCVHSTKFRHKYISFDKEVTRIFIINTDHIDHIKNVAGVDTVGIGGDYDGVERLPIGLEDVSTYPDLFAELVKRGWSNEDLAKLAGENLLRVFKAAEKVRDNMKNEAPNEDTIPADERVNKNCSTKF